MLNHYRATVLRLARRILLALLLAITLLPAPAGPVPPAQAEHQPDHDPDARLQILIKSVTVIDDDDLGAGEFSFGLVLWRVNPGCPTGWMEGGYVPESTPGSSENENCTTDVLRSTLNFSGSGGETVRLNRSIPGPGAWVVNASIGPETGIPVWADQAYGMALIGAEMDDFTPDDEVGTLFWIMTAQNDWSIGAGSDRGRKNIVSSCWKTVISFGFWGGCRFIPPGAFDPADVIVESEIRRMPLPDLRANGITVSQSAEQQFYCFQKQNVGERPSDVFPLTVHVDGGLFRTLTMGALAPGEAAGGPCVARSELPVQEHLLSFRIDEARQVAEMDEHNNVYEYRIPAFQPAATGQQPEANPAHADLTVTAIRVKGKEPSGNNDCDPGDNDVTVTVKNEGTAAAASYTVRLVTGNQSKDKSGMNLSAGSEANVVFDDLMLGKGQHKLTATANVPNPLALIRADDGKLEVTANCQDEGD